MCNPRQEADDHTKRHATCTTNKRGILPHEIIVSGGLSVRMHALLTIMTIFTSSLHLGAEGGQTHDGITSPNNDVWAFESWVTDFL